MDETGQSVTKEVLDHGHVRYIGHLGSDLTVVNAARVSFARASDRFGERDADLIKYLASHRHWTPFAHPQITLSVKAPIAIRTQLFKHKVGFVENEVSRRYVTTTPEFYWPKWRGAPTDGAKQGSSKKLKGVRQDHFEDAISHCYETYNDLIDQGVAPEQARFILPQCTYTEWYWTGSLAAYARVVHLRSDPHAQWEVRQYAEAFSQIIEPLFPVSWEALCSNG